MTALDLITRSLKALGAVAAGETLPDDEAEDGLVALNAMLGSWNAESTMVIGELISTYTLVSGTQTYTIGSGGVFNATRPQKITQANLIYSGVTPNTRLPLDIIDYQQWSDIRILSQPSNTFPSRLYCDYNFPLATIYLWGSPGSSLQLELYTWQALTTFALLTTTFSLPPEYDEALVYNLALRLAPMYDREPSQMVMALAISSKAAIQRLNSTSPIMWPDAAVSGVTQGIFNIYSGQ
jgi:hypothetical protein